jgi:hypothetical protein
MARHVTCRDAAICPQLEQKPTLRGSRECVEFDISTKLNNGAVDRLIFHM